MTRGTSVRIVMLGATAAGCIALLWYANAGRHEQAASLSDLVAAVERGDGDAVGLAKAAALRDWPSSLPVLTQMLAHDNWRVRLTACEVIAAHGNQDDLLPLLVQRASDVDWRVRAAAMQGLIAICPLDRPTPMHNTPLDEREAWLLAWLAAYDASSPARLAAPAAGQICELYANTKAAEFGRPMLARCLTCHAGAAAPVAQDRQSCSQCHADIYTQWNGSAHANSLTHLHLATVDPITRSPHQVEFGAVRGIDCARCHQQDASSSRATTAASSQPSRCPSGFLRAAPPQDTCGSCHASAVRQWQLWQGHPHPQKLDWPPGELDIQAAGDTRTCVDCHMPSPPGPEGAGRSHRWAARRDIAFLKEGVDLKVTAKAVDGRLQVSMQMTNLSGHEFPTGSVRRAIELYAGPSAAEASLVARLSPALAGSDDATPPGTGSALRPGETRTFTHVPGRDGHQIFYRLRFVRNRNDAHAYTADFLEGTIELPRP